MSKRPYEDSLTREPSQSDNSGRLAINDLLSPEEQLNQSPGPAKKPRNFIATVVCFLLTPRPPMLTGSRRLVRRVVLKRQDVTNHGQNADCASRSGWIAYILSANLPKSKLESLPSTINNDTKMIHEKMTQTLNGLRDLGQQSYGSYNKSQDHSSLPNIFSGNLPQETGEPDDFKFDERSNTETPGQVSISFSQHGVILWPGARAILPEKILEARDQLGKNYVVDLETKRPPLPMLERGG
ncbi:C6 finger domain protein [Aspergillus sclerotialis]|uniref:C6 finger domain protein n=1 Tax=Aspergillus sclerotialis TaxID=2070753 RepID=A0A3A2Z5E5_9EURO|nr:C6 finger domain protein [Aspergillus sclerotialis]